MGEKFIVSVIKRNSGKFYGVTFKDETTGKWGTRISLDKLAMKMGNQKHVSSMPQAMRVVEMALKNGLCGERSEQEIPSVESYLRNFWDYDNSDYIKMKNSGMKIRIHRNYCEKSLRNCELHIFPFLPKGILVSQLKTQHLEPIQRSFIQNHSSKAWSNLLGSISIPLNELVRKNIISVNPCNALDRIPIDVKERKILSYDEVTALIGQIRQDIDANRIEKRYGLSIILAFCTGMRQGEIRGLHISSIEIFDISDKAIVHVCESYNDTDKFKGTKNGRDRDVCISKDFAEELIEAAKNNPHHDGLVFFGRYKNTPITPKCMNDLFYLELEKIGITEEERKARFLTIHSARHFVNSELRTRVGQELAMEIVGHTTTSMSLHYDHSSNKRALEIGNKVGNLFDFKEAK